MYRDMLRIIFAHTIYVCSGKTASIKTISQGQSVCACTIDHCVTQTQRALILVATFQSKHL